MYKYVLSHVEPGFINAITLKPVHLAIDSAKLFHGDTFVLDDSQQIVITSSPTREAKEMPAILCLQNNRTYGRANNNKRLYKCVPDDKRIPAFLVAYEMKNVGFSKVFSNKYVLIKYENWKDANPTASLTNTIGDVDIAENYYEYQLHCKGLAHSIQPFVKAVASSLLNNPTFIPSETRQGLILTIDPHGTKDFDDALSITEHADCTYTVSVYIANVTACLDAYGLWSHVDRVSTIYLPNKPRPMLPPRLSEHDCSLVSGQKRIALTMDVLCANNGDIIDVSFKNTTITVSRNYVYEEADLLATRDYRDLFRLTNRMQSINDSHELVAFWMTTMNRLIAEKMHDQYKTGIFRRATLCNNDVLPTEVKNWKNAVCEYVAFGTNVRHDVMEIDKYMHITSPIRRIIDLLNMTKFQACIGVPLSAAAMAFYDKWSDRIDYINEQMRAIRMVQTQCSLLALCSSAETPIECDAYVFDKQNMNEETCTFTVYLKSLNLMYKMKTTSVLENGDTTKVRVVLFNDEYSLKKKIRLQLIK
jgi:exoribonuclease R